MKKSIIISLVFTLLFDFSLAQDEPDSAAVRVAPAQITFIDPLGSNGQRAANTVNHFSINVISGKSAGVKGLELAGILNETGTYGLYGVQAAGIANLGKGNANGIQLGGIFNSANTMQGVQAAGIVNINKGNIQGASIAGIMNKSNGSLSGLSAAGLTNINPLGVKGMQVSGIYNQSASVQGMQLTGISNLATNVKGMQLSGVYNHSSKISGMQLSGISNKTDTLNGLQMGLINVADTAENGVQLGLINIVLKDGYRGFELSYNETFRANAVFRMGLRRFYTNYLISYEHKDNVDYIGLGLGFGAYFPVTSKLGFNVDATAQQINVDEWWTNTLNLNNRLGFNVYFRVLPHLELFAGGAINVSVSQYKNSEGVLVGNPLAPSDTWYKHVEGSTMTQIYPGFNLGLRF